MFAEHDTNSSSDGKRHNVTSWSIHPEYDHSANYNNDFAILTLSDLIDLGDKAKAAQLPTNGIIHEGQILTVSGWGDTEFENDGTNILHSASVPYIPNSKCHQQLYDFAFYNGYTPAKLTQNMMCAGYSSGDIDTCNGDSGGE